MADMSWQTGQPGQLQDSAKQWMTGIGYGDLPFARLRDERGITLAGFCRCRANQKQTASCRAGCSTKQPATASRTRNSPASILPPSPRFVNYSTPKGCRLGVSRIPRQWFPHQRVTNMRRPLKHPLLPFTEADDVWRTLPPETQARCRTLLARLLLRTAQTPENERSSDEHREDSSEPS
jgi:hypothetical protein